MFTVRVGPFELHEKVGDGPMGEVWGGIHFEDKAPIALKIVRHKSARDPRFWGAFRREVQAVCRLTHPGIIRIFDYGRIPERVEIASEGRLEAGCPFVIMELAEAGNLATIAPEMRWPSLRACGLQILDGLAHAHARGITHRALSPENLLLVGGEGGNLRVKLADFGLLHAIDRYQERNSFDLIVGRPTYMAPEQILGHQRELGPWSDLYSVGCILYELVSGRPPFEHRELFKLMQAHLGEPVGELAPKWAVPDGFEAWLLRLMAKSPVDRFERAADAAWALLKLPAARPVATSREPKLAGMDDADLVGDLPTLGSLALLDQDETSSVTGVPPLPSTGWTRSQEPDRHLCSRSVHLLSMGVGALPIVAREAERLLLWQLLGKASEDGSAKVVVIFGQPGLGRGRLMRWFCERTHEVGQGEAFESDHGPMSGMSGGLCGSMQRAFRCVGLDRDATRERLCSLLDGLTVERAARLAQLITPPRPNGPADPPFSAEERFTLFEEVLARSQRDRIATLTMRDVHWAPDDIELCIRLLERQPHHPTPAVCVLSATDDLGNHALASAALERLLSTEGAYQIVLDPMDVSEQIELLRNMIGVDTPLAERIGACTGGSPLMAEEWVAAWLTSGALEVGPRGLRIREGVEVNDFASLRAVWAARLNSLFEGAQPDDRAALELAAVLGSEFSRGDWTAVCDAAHFNFAGERLLQHCFEHRLVESRPTGIAFAHASLSEVLLRQADAAGRLPDLHRICARALADRGLVDEPGRWDHIERVARHTLSSGDLIAARPLLLEAAAERRRRGETHAASCLLELTELPG